jgi:hypothetical protein
MELVGIENVTTEEAKDLNIQLEFLMDKAPSDADGIFTVQKDKNGYRAILKISSLQKKFISACSAASLHDLVERIVTETKGQLETWRRERFAGDNERAAGVAYST